MIARSVGWVFPQILIYLSAETGAILRVHYYLTKFNEERLYLPSTIEMNDRFDLIRKVSVLFEWNIILICHSSVPLIDKFFRNVTTNQ